MGVGLVFDVIVSLGLGVSGLPKRGRKFDKKRPLQGEHGHNLRLLLGIVVLVIGRHLKDYAQH